MNPRTYKKDEPYSYALGAALTMELIRMRPESVRRVYVHSDFVRGEAYGELERSLRLLNVPMEENDRAFRILSQKENCFVIGMFEKYTCTLSRGDHVVLVNPSNGGNIGTILRSCAGFGVKDLAVIRPATDLFDPKAVRASMGALFHMRFVCFDSFEQYAEAFPEHTGYPFMLQADTPLQQTDFRSPFSLIFGNEATGLPGEFLRIGHSVIIPQSGEVDSLNLPVAVSIALYQATGRNFLPAKNGTGA